MVNYFQCAQLSKFQIEFNIKFVNDEMYRVMASLCSTQPASEWNRTKKTKWLFDSCHKTGPSVRTNLPEDPIWWPFSNPSSISSSGKPAAVLHSNPIEFLPSTIIFVQTNWSLCWDDFTTKLVDCTQIWFSYLTFQLFTIPVFAFCSLLQRLFQNCFKVIPPKPTTSTQLLSKFALKICFNFNSAELELILNKAALEER